MYFTYGEVTTLQGGEWYILELKNETSVEVYLRRLIRVIPGVFKLEPAEIYVPLKNRDLDEFELLEGPFVYVRAKYFVGIMRLKKVWGVVGVATKGDSNLMKDTIKVGDDYVQSLREREAQEEGRRIEGLTVGSGVRLLDGKYRDFCGKVTEISGEAVTVMLNLGFRRIELQTFQRNLRTITADGRDVCWVPDLLRVPDPERMKTEGE